MRQHRTIIIFKVMQWNSRTFQDYYYRYIEPFSRKCNNDNSFEFNDFMLSVIRYTLDLHFLSADEAQWRLEDYLDLYFVANESYGREQITEDLLSESERFRLIKFIEELSPVIEYDLIHTFETYRLPYTEDDDVDTAIVRGENISFALVDFTREVW